MVKLDLNVKEVVSLSDNMDRDKFNSFLEQFGKEDFIKHFLDEFDEERAEDNTDNNLTKDEDNDNVI